MMRNARCLREAWTSMWKLGKGVNIHAEKRNESIVVEVYMQTDLKAAKLGVMKWS